MLEDFLGARSKVRLLRDLIYRPGQELTTDDLVRTTGQSTGTLVPALQQLQSTGLIHTRLVGKSRVYKFNEQHPLAAALRRLFDDEARTLHQIVESIVRLLPKEKIRYAGWLYEQTKTEEARPTALIFVIGDDPKALEDTLRKAIAGRNTFNLKVYSPDEARSALASGGLEYSRMIELSRVVYADKAWLET